MPSESGPPAGARHPHSGGRTRRRGAALEEALLTRMSDRIAATGPETVYGLLGDYLGDAELFARVRLDVLQTGAGVMNGILMRAAERGEARPGVHGRVASVPTDLFRNELFLRRTPPDATIIAEIVDHVFLPLVGP
jgi:Tetracyclin repressor-like, C-terminal domain